ncbi:MAG TPA: glycerophosphodiester phosphodiesterase family protein [Pyrinomonadaceae bacterium]|nr:glycerophosphodiester phosphodiesterase family protein [Pyrinomonadaceae bacterium]
MSRRGDISDSRLLIIGHRGASAYAPENTLAAFAQAFEDGADGIELDVRLARDGVPVVVHDATLSRIVLCDGLVESLASEELCALDVGTRFNHLHPELAREEFARERIPTLAQVFERFGASARVLYVEMKCDPALHAPLARSVVELTRAHGLADRVVVKSFAHDSLREVKRLAPEVRTAALFKPKWSRPLLSASRIVEEAARCGADEISLHRSLLRRATTGAALARGLPVLVWTVDTPFWLRRAEALGLRAIFTSRPAEMKAALGEIRARELERVEIG